MSTVSMRTVFAVLALAFAGTPGLAGAAEIRALVTIALQSVMEDLAPKFEKATGHKLKAEYALGMALAKRAQGGEAADLVVLPQAGLDLLNKAGKLAPGSEVVLARSSVGVAVRKGWPKPDISSPEALKRTLLSAKSISYSDPAFGGASGVHFAKVLERLGIAQEVKAKTKFPPEGGFTAKLLVAGEVELAIQQLGELLSIPGAELVGALPGDLNNVTTFGGAVPSNASQPAAATALIKYLQSAEAAAVMKAKGLDPAASMAAELQVLAGRGIAAPMKEIAAQFEKTTGHKLVIRYGTTPELVKMATGGPFDLAVVPVDVMNNDSARATFVAGASPEVARVGLGVAVRAGAPKPDIKTADALKRTLLDAKSIASIPESATGYLLARIYASLGITEAMKARIKPQPTTEAIGQSVANGDTELAVFLTNILTAPGIDLVGPFPPEVQANVVYTAAVSAGTKEAEASRAFIAYFRSPEAVAVIKSKGMSP